MSSMHIRSVTDPDKDDFFIEFIDDVTITPWAAIEKTAEGKFELHLFEEREVDAIEFILLVQQAIDQLRES